MGAAGDVVLVDAGGTNIGSVRSALRRLGIDAVMTADADRIRAAGHVILPGVGAAGPGMSRLRVNGLDTVIPELTQPVLGVCLGMQLLFGHCEEDDVAGLGIVPGRVRRLAAGAGIRVPHMGWNRLQAQRDDPLLDGIDMDAAWAYFVHSYAAPVGADTIAISTHGAPFAAIVRRGNFCGMQFHPERSSALGARLLENFLALPTPLRRSGASRDPCCGKPATFSAAQPVGPSGPPADRVAVRSGLPALLRVARR
jgi:glutamine amidotransferase